MLWPRGREHQRPHSSERFAGAALSEDEQRGSPTCIPCRVHPGTSVSLRWLPSSTCYTPPHRLPAFSQAKFLTDDVSRQSHLSSRDMIKRLTLDAEEVFFKNRGKVLPCSTAMTQLEFTKYTPRRGPQRVSQKLQRTLEFVLF